MRHLIIIPVIVLSSAMASCAPTQAQKIGPRHHAAPQPAQANAQAGAGREMPAAPAGRPGKKPLAGPAAGAAGWNSYEVYSPNIETVAIYGGGNAELQYVHCPSLAFFKDRWFAVWQGNTVHTENAVNQSVYLSTSRDFSTWSDPVPVFVDESHSVNPLPGGGEKQLQPSMAVVGGELWSFWTQIANNRAHRGTYVAKLASPTGKWEVQRILFDGSPFPKLNGVEYLVNPMQNPIVLPSGRVLVPVVAMDNDYSIPFPDRQKHLAVIYADPGGPWKLSQVTGLAERPSGGVWENFVVALQDGGVRMYARNMLDKDASLPADKLLLTSVSKNQGESWSAVEYVPVETISSRTHALPVGASHFVMAAHDFKKGGEEDRAMPTVAEWIRRNNLAMFFSRTGSPDWVAGNDLTGKEMPAIYPQLFIKDRALHMAYSAGGVREIKAVRVSPLPQDGKFYLFPRSLPLSGTKPEEKNIAGVRAVEFAGPQSAGVDIETLDMRDGHFEFQVKFRLDQPLAEGEAVTVFTSGSAVNYLKVYAQGKKLIATAAGQRAELDNAYGGGWETVLLSVSHGTAAVNFKGKSFTFKPSYPYPQIYLGAGYRDGGESKERKLYVDIASVKRSLQAPR